MQRSVLWFVFVFFSPSRSALHSLTSLRCSLSCNLSRLRIPHPFSANALPRHSLCRARYLASATNLSFLLPLTAERLLPLFTHLFYAFISMEILASRDDPAPSLSSSPIKGASSFLVTVFLGALPLPLYSSTLSSTSSKQSFCAQLLYTAST